MSLSGEHTRLACWRPRPRDRELHYIAAATVCGYDLTADVFPRAKRTKVQTLGRIARMAAAGTFANLPGALSGRARYIKEVDAAERTVRFAQEIYDASRPSRRRAREISRRFGPQTVVKSTQ